MTTSISTVHILVDDPDAALAFYRDTLGLTVKFQVEQGGFRWITLVSESQPEIGIVLSQPHAGRSQEDGDAIAAQLAKGELYPVHFRVDDLDESFARIAETPGVEVLSEPASQPWGVRDAAVRDPAGNRLRIEQAERRDHSSGPRDGPDPGRPFGERQVAWARCSAISSRAPASNGSSRSASSRVTLAVRRP
jgi:catechol 2,3-dioxygenase-like lactoylglutathione lyase family enzyme